MISHGQSPLLLFALLFTNSLALGAAGAPPLAGVSLQDSLYSQGVDSISLARKREIESLPKWENARSACDSACTEFTRDHPPLEGAAIARSKDLVDLLKSVSVCAPALLLPSIELIILRQASAQLEKDQTTALILLGDRARDEESPPTVDPPLAFEEFFRLLDLLIRDANSLASADFGDSCPASALIVERVKALKSATASLKNSGLRIKDANPSCRDLTDFSVQGEEAASGFGEPVQARAIFDSATSTYSEDSIAHLGTSSCFLAGFAQRALIEKALAGAVQTDSLASANRDLSDLISPDDVTLSPEIGAGVTQITFP